MRLRKSESLTSVNSHDSLNDHETRRLPIGQFFLYGKEVQK